MFKVVLDEWVCKNAPMIKEFGCPPYLLASAIESSTALSRACNNCEMLEPLPGCPSISFIAPNSDRVGVARQGIVSALLRYVTGDIYPGTALTPRASFLPEFAWHRRMECTRESRWRRG